MIRPGPAARQRAAGPRVALGQPVLVLRPGACARGSVFVFVFVFVLGSAWTRPHKPDISLCAPALAHCTPHHYTIDRFVTGPSRHKRDPDRIAGQAHGVLGVIIGQGEGIGYRHSGPLCVRIPG